MSDTETLNDFGFSFEQSVEQHDQSIAQMQSMIDHLTQVNKTLFDNSRIMYAKIFRLLENLKQEPEKETIKWPNRVQQIDKFIKELEEFRPKKEDNFGKE